MAVAGCRAAAAIGDHEARPRYAKAGQAPRAGFIDVVAMRIGDGRGDGAFMVHQRSGACRAKRVFPAQPATPPTLTNDWQDVSFSIPSAHFNSVKVFVTFRIQYTQPPRECATVPALPSVRRRLARGTTPQAIDYDTLETQRRRLRDSKR